MEIGKRRSGMVEGRKGSERERRRKKGIGRGRGEHTKRGMFTAPEKHR